MQWNIPHLLAKPSLTQRKNLWFNCLGHHRAAQCRSKARCKDCIGKHHSSLCETITDKDRDKQTKQDSAPLPDKKPSDITASVTVSIPPKSPEANILPNNVACLLKTAIAEVRSGINYCKAHILFDEGAQRSFMTQQLADTLKVESCTHHRIHISAFGGEAIPRELQSTSIAILTYDGGEVLISVMIVPKIAAPQYLFLGISTLTFKAFSLHIQLEVITSFRSLY